MLRTLAAGLEHCDLLIRWTRCRNLKPGPAEVAQIVHQVIVVFDDLALLVTPIYAPFGLEVLKRLENLQLPRRGPRPHAVNAGLNRVVRRHKLQTKSGVLSKQ